VLRHPARRLPWIDARRDLPRQPRPHPAPGDRPSSGRLPRDPRRVGHLRRIMRRCRVSRLTGAGTVSGAGARPRGRRDQPSDHGLRPYRLATLHTRRDEKFYLGPDGKLFTVTDRVKLEDFVGPRPSALKAAGAAGSRVLKPCCGPAGNASGPRMPSAHNAPLGVVTDRRPTRSIPAVSATPDGGAPAAYRRSTVTD
jgi:hypothetical protein